MFEENHLQDANNMDGVSKRTIGRQRFASCSREAIAPGT